MELTDRLIDFLLGMVAEWNASAYTATGMLEGIGIQTHPVDFRFGQVTSNLQRLMICGAETQIPLIFSGTTHTGLEVRAFHHLLKTIKPPIGVLVTPSEIPEFRINGPVWTQQFWIDSAAIGDVLGGSWNVLLCARKPLTLPTVGYAAGMPLAEKYIDIDEEAASDRWGQCASMRFAIQSEARRKSWRSIRVDALDS